MTDYSAEIAALRTALASGVTRVAYDGKSTEFGTRQDLLARLRWLESLQNGGVSSAPQSAVASFDRGDC